MLLALALIQAAVPASQPTPAPAEAKLVCKRVQEVGSRLPGKKTCLTKEEWAAQERDGRDALSTMSQPR
ncbi:hypothetical protein [Sphingomonas sp. Mn802worker]|uniref:hypothetical protein n=1 Tax=Sphingomonas sp. Mn802worker TaxID=629773 RepID=UPI0003787394|nr:hypothetical protein [Sphingomonas sp. Mn802worker]